MKRIICLCAIFFVVLNFTGCKKNKETGFQFYENANRGYTIFIGEKFNSETTEVYIPATYKGKPVTDISLGFRNNYKADINLWQSIQTGQTDKIKAINIPATIKSIYYGAFRDCMDLEEINISDDNPYYRSEGNCVIEKKTNQLIATCGKSIIPDDLTDFSAEAFRGAYILNNFPNDSVAYVNKWVIGFNGNPDTTLLLKSDTIGIADQALAFWFELESIELPPSLTYIGSFAFYRCKSLTNIFIPGSVEQILYYAFYGCDVINIYLEALEIPDSWPDLWNGYRPIICGANSD